MNTVITVVKRNGLTRTITLTEGNFQTVLVLDNTGAQYEIKMSTFTRRINSGFYTQIV